MHNYRQVAVGETVSDAVTVGIERNGEGKIVATVWWPAHGDFDGDETSYDSVPEAFAAAEAAQKLNGFTEIVVTLQNDDLWDTQWGALAPANKLSDDEAFELARATEAMSDA